MADPFVLVMRHARHVDGRVGPDGRTDVHGVAARLAEWLAGRRDPCDDRDALIEVLRTATPEAIATAQILTVAANMHLRRSAPTTSVRLAPTAASELHAALGDTAGLGPYRPDDRTSFDEIARSLESPEASPPQRVLVGNDPFVSQLVQRLSGDELGLVRGELVCLVPREHGKRPWKVAPWKVAWTIAPDDPPEPIRAKIRSKMNAATGLGAFVTALLGFALRDELRNDPVMFDWLAFAALGLSASFYFSALFLYDSLLMPDRFWGSRLRPARPRRRFTARIAHRIEHGRPGLLRPPSSTVRVLQQAMVRIWSRVFVPATGALGVGVALLAAGPAGLGSDDPWSPGWRALVVGGWLVVLAIMWIMANRPQLGTSD